MKRLFERYIVFLKRLSEIKEYIDKTTFQNELIDSIEKKMTNIEDAETEYFRYLKSLKSSTIQYNAVIISVYACFENFVDALAAEYCNLVFQDATSFTDVPGRLRKKIQLKIGEYLTNPHRFPDEIKLEKTINDYSSMLYSNLSSPVHLYFPTSHSGNLKSSEIATLFYDLTEANTRAAILNSQSIMSFYVDSQLMDVEEFEQKKNRAQQSFENSEIMKPLETLVAQRNAVAHSWHEDNRVSIDYIKNSIIPFLQALSYVLLELCVIRYTTLAKSAYSLPNNAPIKVFNNSIVCINNQSTLIKVGDYIVYGTAQQTKCAKVINIQYNNVDISSVDDTQSIDVGIQLDGKFAESDFIKYIINL